MPKPKLMQNNFDEKLLQLLISRVEDYAIYTLDPNGYILSWNQGAKNIIGYHDEEVLGHHISMFYTTQERRENIPGNNLNDALKITFTKARAGACVKMVRYLGRCGYHHLIR
jgi:PAS domain-containing protein